MASKGEGEIFLRYFSGLQVVRSVRNSAASSIIRGSAPHILCRVILAPDAMRYNHESLIIELMGTWNFYPAR